MRHWVRKFKLYFESLHGEMLPISGQKGILGNLLSSALETALTYLLEHLDKDLQDCMVALELHFLTLKPILGRGWDMLHLKKTFRPMKDFMTEVRAFAAEAELTKLTPEKIQVLVVLRGCRKEAALYRELRKIEEPTMDKLLAAGLLEEKLAREVATSHVITAVGASPAVETAKEIMGDCRCMPGCGRGHTRDAKGWLAKIVDDLCRQAPTMNILMDRLEALLQTSIKSGITLSLSKLEVGTSVKFKGFVVSGYGLRPDSDKIASICDYPAPTSLTELQSFLGLANQLGPFVPDLSHAMVKICDLVK
eukprot:TCALIF_12448-PA protein Name:"Similar to pol Retrovirus-related Pol polyprotein from transposon opus (Drosophila melanogaster)" AED:0.39 eAED:0.39 QI:0/0/0/0.5/1/1/2/0/306